MSAAAHAVRRQRHDAGERPFLVIRESTRACPLACLHCRAEAVPDRDPRELDTVAAKDLLAQVAAFGRPAPLFVITGGDPFQRPPTSPVIAYGREAGVRMAPVSRAARRSWTRSRHRALSSRRASPSRVTTPSSTTTCAAAKRARTARWR
ncbi:radical SAM protein [Streptomyces sp. NPDC018947]|uniref:radical SAM protein n=1 Tax=Streptomyces sp. NPDC018947 TaxID=3365054 RepID=UPI0037B41CB7